MARKKLEPKPMLQLIEDDANLSPLQSEITVFYDRMKTEREDEEAMIEVADAMEKGYQNKAISAIERSAAANGGDKWATERAAGGDEEDRSLTVSDVGSPMFNRIVTQHASVLTTITNSKTEQWRYSPIKNDEIWDDTTEDQSQANLGNVLAQYALEQGCWQYRKQDAFRELVKYTNLPFTIKWESITKKIAVLDKDLSVQKKEMKIAEYPVLEAMPWTSLFADKHVGDLQKQKWVFVTSPEGVYDLAPDKWTSEEKLKEVVESWEGYRMDVADVEAEETLRINKDDEDTDASDHELRRWDAYGRVRIGSDGNIAENSDFEAEWTLIWMVGYGREPNIVTWVKCCTEFDPDDEIPIKMIHTTPGDANFLYHGMMSQLIRPIYSQECTFVDLAVDAANWEVNPVRLWNPDEFDQAPDNLRLTPGDNYKVRDVARAVAELRMTSEPKLALELVKYLQGSQEMMAWSNPNMLGQKFNNISATENINVNRYTLQPQLAWADYTLQQLYGWAGKKFRRYYEAFGDTDMIMQVGKDALVNDNAIKDIYGEFDVTIDIVDEYIDDTTSSQQILSFMQMMSSNPALLESQQHKVDIAEMVTTAMKMVGIKEASTMVSLKSGDAKRVQQGENALMRTGGLYTPPEQDEDHIVHIAVVDAERLNILPHVRAAQKGERDENSEFYISYDELLVQHKEAHQSMQAGAGANAPAAGAELTPGQATGLQQSAALGATNGGPNGVTS